MATTSIYCPSCGAHNSIDADRCFACQHPLHEPVHETLLHNRYRVLDQLGSGGFGAVHRAEDTHEQGKIVAIKQINLAGLTPQQVIEATDGFNREVSLLSTLTHPHLPHIYEHFTDPDHWYLVMDFLEGETLETYLDKTYMKRGSLTPLPLTEVLDIGLQLCTVLDYLHTREPAIIFRDVKPANVMRTPTGMLYLIDFGIARHYKPGKPKDTIPFGSPGYAAPEQYGKAQTTPRSDIYSLGALLHMLLSGNDPVDNPFHFNPLRLYGEGIHELTTMIERMVSLDAEQRPQTVQEVKNALQAINDAQTHACILPVAVTPPPPQSMTTQFVGKSGSGLQQMMMQRQQLRKQRQQYWSYNRRKSRRGFVIGTVGVVSAMALVGAGLGGLLQLGGTQSEPCNCPPPQSPLFRQAYSLERVYPETAQIHNIAWSPDGGSVVLAANRRLCVQKVDIAGLPQESTDKIEMVYDTPSSILALAWQPETGGRVAFASDKTLNFWSEKWVGRPVPSQYVQKEIETLPDAGSANEKVVIQSIAWSSDGTYIAIPFLKGVQIWNVRTQTHVKNLLFNPALSRIYEENQITSLAWSPDGQYIVAAFSNLYPAIWHYSDGKFYENVTEQQATLVAWSPDSQLLASAANSGIHVALLSFILIKAQGNPLQDSSSTAIDYGGHTGTVTTLAWSPDGRYIASGSDDTGDNLQVWTPFDVSNGPPLKNQTSLGSPAPESAYVFLTNVSNNGIGVRCLCWSPDGKSLLVGTNNASIIPLNTKMLG